MRGASSTDPEDLITAVQSRGRGVWPADLTAAAIIAWAREKYRTSQSFGDKGAVPFGW